MPQNFPLLSPRCFLLDPVEMAPSPFCPGHAGDPLRGSASSNCVTWPRQARSSGVDLGMGQAQPAMLFPGDLGGNLTCLAGDLGLDLYDVLILALDAKNHID